MAKDITLLCFDYNDTIDELNKDEMQEYRYAPKFFEGIRKIERATKTIAHIALISHADFEYVIDVGSNLNFLARTLMYPLHVKYAIGKDSRLIHEYPDDLSEGKCISVDNTSERDDYLNTKKDAVENLVNHITQKGDNIKAIICSGDIKVMDLCMLDACVPHVKKRFIAPRNANIKEDLDKGVYKANRRNFMGVAEGLFYFAKEFENSRLQAETFNETNNTDFSQDKTITTLLQVANEPTE